MFSSPNLTFFFFLAGHQSAVNLLYLITHLSMANCTTLILSHQIRHWMQTPTPMTTCPMETSQHQSNHFHLNLIRLIRPAKETYKSLIFLVFPVMLHVSFNLKPWNVCCMIWDLGLKLHLKKSRCGWKTGRRKKKKTVRWRPVYSWSTGSWLWVTDGNTVWRFLCSSRSADCGL